MDATEKAPGSYRKFANLVALTVAETVLDSGGIDSYIESLRISSPDDVDGSLFPKLKAYLVERMPIRLVSDSGTE